MKVLGVSGAFGHDAAAALVVDGHLVAACEEERFSRTKRATRQAASQSVQACLDAGGLDLPDLDCIAIGWDPDLAPGDRRLADNLELLLSGTRFYDAKLGAVRRVPHHLAHAALGFYTSGYQTAAVLVMDGQGEDVSTTIWRGSDGLLTECARYPVSDSLGFFFAAVTRYLGFDPGSAGKTMGLAPMGRVSYDFPELRTSTSGYDVLALGVSKPERMRWWLRRLTDVFGPPAQRKYAINPVTGSSGTSSTLLQHHADAAASAQVALERVVTHLSGVSTLLTGSQDLVLSGGVALNCTANGRLRGARANQGLYVCGAAHDGGTALGAALAVAATEGDVQRPDRSRDLFLGPRFDVGAAVEMARRAGLLVTEPPDGVALSAAERIAASEVGGWFRGRSEYGPRALGGRSIVARSDVSTVAARVNRIKRREAWRPLAPAMSLSEAVRLGVAGDGLDFMVEARWLDERQPFHSVSGVMHVDRSVRPLVVDVVDHPFADLLAAMAELTGQQAITNTSFNTEQEPIVNSPSDALRTFLTSDLDFLVLEDVLVRKPLR